MGLVLNLAMIISEYIGSHEIMALLNSGVNIKSNNKCNQDCRNYVCNIPGTFQEMIVQGICQKKSQQGTRG